MAHDKRILLLMAVCLLARPRMREDAPAREEALDLLLRPYDATMRITLPAKRVRCNDIVLRDHFFAAQKPEYPRVTQKLSSQHALRQPQVRCGRLYRR